VGIRILPQERGRLAAVARRGPKIAGISGKTSKIIWQTLEIQPNHCQTLLFSPQKTLFQIV
jgi:hypothetical protein